MPYPPPVAPRARQAPPRYPPPRPPLGWSDGPRRPMGPRPAPGRGLLVLVAVVLLIVIVGLFLFVRGSSGPSGEFLTAHDRFVAAAHRIEGAESKVARYLQLQEFKTTVDRAIVVLHSQSVVFQRLASSESGEARTIAQAAYRASISASLAVDTYADAIIRTLKIADAQTALVTLDAAVAELDRQAAAWRKLS